MKNNDKKTSEDKIEKDEVVFLDDKNKTEEKVEIEIGDFVAVKDLAEKMKLYYLKDTKNQSLFFVIR